MVVLKWGIVSAGKISNDFAVGLSCLPPSEHKIVAVAARDIKRAQNFAKQHNISTAYGSYLELAEDPEIDIAYIGSVNTEHFAVSKLMLANGKHVLCEKPLCLNRKQSLELIKFAQTKNLFLMEAIWSRFFPAYKYLKQQIDNGLLGEVQYVEACFGFDLNNVDRLQKRDLGGGTVLDLGVYTIQICQWVMQETPVSIEADGELNEEGVDIAVNVTLNYSHGKTGKFSTSAKRKLNNTAVIKGTKGQITLENFWCPTALVDVDGTIKTWELPKTDKFINFVNSQGLCYQAIEVRDAILGKLRESPIVSHKESLLIADIQDTIRQQIGVKFDAN